MKNTKIKWTAALQSAEEVLLSLKDTPELFIQYKKMSNYWKQRFLEFMEGKRSLPLTYDPFFKKIFHPDIYKDRLESLISSLLGMSVHVVGMLPNEDSMIAEESLLIMDLLVELEDGSLCNIEIQKQPYGFPAERISCYSADLLMRQYTRIKGEKGHGFGYKDIKKVYVIVIYERSTDAFHEHSDKYIHYGEVKFHTGLNLDLLQEYCLIALDVFSENTYPKIRNTQTAWLSLLATDSMEHVDALIEEYPWMEEIYKEIAMLRHKPEEVLGMYSEALRKSDENTLKYFVEQQQDKIEQHLDTIAQQMDKLFQLEEQISQQEKQIIQQEERITQQEGRIAELERLLAEARNNINI